MKRGDALLLIATVLLLSGVGALSVPAALIVGGGVVGAAWYWFVDDGGAP